ncbi:MAG TPA: molecular chaperone TorD family protein [Anaerolineales bacterium]
MDASPSELAQARDRAYALFARLFQKGLTADLLPLVTEIPELADDAHLKNYDADRAGADHYELFGFNVFPYASVFLDESATLGGRVTQNILSVYHKSGFDVPLESESADHIALQLQFLAFLSAAEGEALEDGLVQVALSINQLQRQFMDEHLLTWLPAFVLAIRQQQDVFHSNLADLTLEMVLHHRADLGNDLLAPETSFSLPPAPDLLADQKTGLKEIAAYLVIPAYSGLYLSRRDITRLARSQLLPRGFGSRQQMLTNLLRSSADYDHVPALLEDIRALVAVWMQSYQSLAGSGAGRFAIVWQDRLESTDRLLSFLNKAIKN